MQLPIYPIDAPVVLRCGVLKLLLPLDGLDTLSRPVLEGRSLIYKPSTDSYRVCPFRDSRYKDPKPMNVAALKHFIDHKQEVYSYINLIKNTLRKCAGDNTKLDIFATTYFAYKAPLYWLVPNWCGYEYEVNPHISAASKICHGILELLFSDSDYIFQNQESFSPNSIYEYAEEKFFLHGSTEVCAGPIDLILEFMENLMNFNPNTKNNTISNSEINDVYSVVSIIWNIEKVFALYNFLRIIILKRKHVELSIYEHAVPTYYRFMKIYDAALKYERDHNNLNKLYFADIFPVKVEEHFVETYSYILNLLQNSDFSKAEKNWIAFKDSSYSYINEINLLFLENHRHRFDADELPFNNQLIESFIGDSP